ncbi:ribonuclease H-like domain-containing protein [Tanacetum coccineum]|uniref:Ribonuclease H-like domain-containing protein n=1 Tax=Tanacetum coccineum TaxID=301880 RepID=A0ABQ5G1R2_9ASTR
MDLETTQTNATAKLPLLKQGEYEMWRLRVDQYFQIQDYALWDVIENGNSLKPTVRTTSNAYGTSTSMIPGPVTTEEKAQKKNDVKSRSMLLMVLPNEHQLTFNQYKDAKTLFAAIQTRFGSNDATKKTQKTLLKQSYKNFNAPSTESLDSIFNRLQKIVSQNKPDLETIGFDDLYNNIKIVEQEVKRTGTSSSNSSSQNMAFVSTPSSINEANTVNGQVSTANSSVSTDSNLDKQIHDDDLKEMDLKWQLALLSMRARKYYQRTGKKITINGSDTAGYDKSKVECFNCHKMGYFARECRCPRNQKSRPRNQDSSRRTVNAKDTSSKAMMAIDGDGFDWSFMAEEEVTTYMALMAFSDSEVYNDKTFSNTCLKSFKALKTQLDNLRVEFNKSEFNLATYKRGLASIEEQLVFYKKNEVMFCDQIVVLKRDALFKDSKIIALKSEIEKLKKEKECNQIKIDKFENASKCLDKLIRSQISDNSRKDTSNEVKKTSDTPLVEELVLEKEKQTVFPTKIEFVKQQDKTARKPVKSFDHIQAHCKYHQRERMVYGNNYNRVNYNYTTNRTHPNAQRNMVPRAVLMKTGLKSFNTARTVNTAHPKSTVYSAKPMSCFSKSAQSTVKRPYQSKTVLTNKNFSQKVNTAKVKVNTVRPKVVNTARPNSAVVNTVRDNQENAVKSLACWVWRPTKLDSIPPTDDQGYVDSGFSRHMTGNISYLLDFQEFDGGYVTFGGGANRGKITGKGTLKTGKLDFQDVFFVKELKFNLFSISHICDKKNCVLFTDIACYVLSPDFKLPGESQIFTKILERTTSTVLI